MTPFSLIGSAGVWYAFANSDGMGKAIVFLLFVGSMTAWFIMIEKGLGLYRAQKLSERFAAQFAQRHGLNCMLRDAADNPCPVARVYLSGMEQLLEFYGMNPEEARRNVAGSIPKLSPAQLDAVQTALEREVSGQIFVIEERIGVLATAVSLSPFLGLFGTVWGVMLAFCGVAAAGSANIQALAPGVAGALLTTVAGLLVAIPSLVGYNTLTQMVRKITVSMDNFSEAFMARLKLEQLGARDAVPPRETPPEAQRKFAPAQTAERQFAPEAQRQFAPAQTAERQFAPEATRTPSGPTQNFAMPNPPRTPSAAFAGRPPDGAEQNALPGMGQDGAQTPPDLF